MPTTILLIRHGQTEWNRVERFRGRYDLPLNDTGLQQAQKTARLVATRWNISALYASPLQRAVQTAQAIADACHVPVQTAAGLVDIDYGQWQGLSPEEAAAKWPDLVSAWRYRPQDVHIPGGETLGMVRRRAFNTLKDLCRRHLDQHIALVSHTVINRLLLMSVLNISTHLFWHLHQEPCAINIIQYSEKGFSLVSMNDTCHLYE